LAYACVAKVNPALKARNGSQRDGGRCRNSTPLKAGLRVSELKADIATEIAMVNAN